MSSQKIILMSAALLLLGGCGVEDSSSQTSNGIMAPLAGDAFEVLSKNDGQTTVSLRDVVIDPQGLPLTLESVVATGLGCEEPRSINKQALTFTVDNAKPELCFYRYSVKNHPAQSSLAKTSEANSYVLKSANATSLLSPISKTTQVGTPITVNIAAVPGYKLDSEVVVLGDGSAVADSTASTITYTPNAQGVTRLIYAMTSNDGTDMMSGTVDVAVSDVGNTAPSVVPVELIEQPGDAGYFDINQSYTIDLSDYVSDDDGDDVQLIQVKAWNATVAPAAPDDTSNMSFTFQTNKSGAHYVTYVVSDHRGGYGVEQVRIETYDLSSGATWNDIQKGTKLFSAPLTQLEALDSEVAFTSSHIDSIGSKVATFSFEQAQRLCETKGNLPTPDNLAELMAFEGGPATKGWPTDIAYWANDDGRAALINLRSGATETESASGHYVTCLNERGFVIDAESSDFEAVANGAEKATVAVKLTFNGQPVEGELIEASTTNTNVTFDAVTGTTDSSGTASFALSSLVAEVVPVNITYTGETLMQDVTFVADESTSRLSLDVTKDNEPDVNKVVATMVDANLNPLVGRVVEFESDAGHSVKITPEKSTNTEGKQKASVVWRGDTLTEDATVNITARFTPPSTGTEISDTAGVTFTSTNDMSMVCGGAVNDDDPVNAKFACLKIATDKDGNWFTSPPSLAMMDVLGYTRDAFGYEKTYSRLVDEKRGYGPENGLFVTFKQYKLYAQGGTGGQFDLWCQDLAAMRFGGKSTWRRPTLDELLNLNATYSDKQLWTERGWPITHYYGTSTNGHTSSTSYDLYAVIMYTGYALTKHPTYEIRGSCIAKP
ncbi:Ig-like domain-containing protein [Vibrio alginolyticus]|uniref:Ig-like domain-containing protein n=1 Tax=Vibrio alginolyticus TaxID=663 RepID=UPI00215C608B|nr:Ig-like domain-containing protein [Vibrio alginolyticus]MCR9352118.1 Ig-like domain-containing protein [Vibrio alginolyticus]MCR9362553.1 Ig-like domain-containing protein [Vibrio alginolyticus]